MKIWVSDSVLLAGAMALAASSLTAKEPGVMETWPEQAAESPFSAFISTDDRIRHRLDYSIWDYALIRTGMVIYGEGDYSDGGALPDVK